MAITYILPGCLLAVAAVAAVSDVTAGKIPNWLTYPAVVLGLALGGLLERWDGLLSHAIGLGAAFLPLFFFYRLGAGLGGGDVKLMAAVGALSGWPAILPVMLYSFIVAAVMGLVMMVWRRQTWPTFKRLGRTLKSVLLPGVAIVSPTAPESIQVPFAASVCLGTAWFLIESRLGMSLWAAGRLVV